MIVAIAGHERADGAHALAKNLALLRVRSGRKVLLVDTDAKKPLHRWSRERALAGVRPAVPAQILDGADQLESLLPRFNDIVIGVGDQDTPEGRVALIAASLVVVPVHAGPVDLAQQYKLIARLNLARQFNPGLRVLFVLVAKRADPGADELAPIRAYAARVMAARLADTVVCAHDGAAYGDGRCLCDAETCDPDIAAQAHALYEEVFAKSTPRN